jgi:hypothetical protein
MFWVQVIKNTHQHEINLRQKKTVPRQTNLAKTENVCQDENMLPRQKYLGKTKMRKMMTGPARVGVITERPSGHN